MIKIVKENITVREFNQDDYPQFLKQLIQNEGWNKYFQLWKQSKEGALALFTKHLTGYLEYNIVDTPLMLGIFTKSGLLIGECGFEYNPETKQVEIFFGLADQAQGKGFAKEVVAAIVDASKEVGINVIHAVVPEQHKICNKLLENAGFNHVGNYELEVSSEMSVDMRHYSYKNI